MNKRLVPVVRLVALAVLLAAGAAVYFAPAIQPVHAQSGSGVLAPNGQRGISFVSTPSAPFGSQASFESLKRLHDTGANWVSVVATFRQHVARSTSFYRSGNDPADGGIAQIIAYAHSLGMRAMLQPIVLADD